MNRTRQGVLAEERAAAHLLAAGYTILTRRFRVRGGEIDIVAAFDDLIVFVEVRSRTKSLPEDAFGPKKASFWRAAANEYFRRNDLDEIPHRFDFIAVEGDKLRHHTGYLD